VLLGISPGRIDFLCGLECAQTAHGLAFSEALSDATAGGFSPPKVGGRDAGTKEAP
jgi:hypothetical protein